MIQKHTIATILLLVLCATGCTKQNFYKPKPAGISGPQKDAPEDYTKRWNDGCESGMGTMTTTYSKTFYGYKLDTNLITNAEYYRAWRDAYTYCRHYAFKYVWDGFDSNSSMLMDNKICVFCF
jgi:hypothetical protein